MFYPKNKQKNLSDDLFRNPTSEYRGTPFWAWNDDLSKDELLWQIEQFKLMGLGGFHMHTRSGLATPYLSDEYMALVKACVDKAKDEGMLAYLYDEDRWPSGAAGGIVTKTPKFRQKCLIFACEGTKEAEEVKNITLSTAYTSESTSYDEVKEEVEKCAERGEKYLLACFDVSLNTDGTLASYKIIDCKEKATGSKWYAFVSPSSAGNGWFNNQAYVDTLMDEAIEEFIKVTHERYKQVVGEEFGKVVPSIFTDEPQFARSGTLPFATSKVAVSVPWTTDLPQTFIKEKGFDVIVKLPEIFWNLNDKPATVRYAFRDHVAERFTRAFSDQIGAWCNKNGVALTGHMMEEPTLNSQTAAVGEAMRGYRGFGIPGIDLLCNKIEVSTAKQTQSTVHQYGREAMLSELYGVTGWQFDFRGHKFQGDWQAVLGVTVRVPHLSWVSMKGSAKRDYPASISYQSAWYNQYKYIEDHFARVNTAMTRGVPAVSVGVIHPIESYWLAYGPSSNTAKKREQLQSNFENVSDWLLRGCIDFDYISESLLPSLYKESDDKTLCLGKMKYSAVVVAGVDTLRSSTVKALTQFALNGGKVIFMGGCPSLVDAKVSDEARYLYELSSKIEFTEYDLLESLKGQREIEIVKSSGAPCKDLIYAKRNDEDCDWVFVASLTRPVPGDKHRNDSDDRRDVRIRFKGKVKPTLYDTISGEIKEVAYCYQNGWTETAFTLYTCDSLLIKLEKTDKTKKIIKSVTPEITKTISFKEKVDFALGEDNVLVLDMPEWSEDGETYNQKEEMLRIDKSLRDKYGFPMANGRDAQPWVIGEVKPEKSVYLKFTINSKVSTSVKLAYETAEEIKLNGESVAIAPDGYFTDKRIYTTALPALKKGKNELIIKAPLGKRTSLENYFLLGKFGVVVAGSEATVVPMPKRIAFGTLADNGLPFYGATVTYRMPFSLNKKSDIAIKAPRYAGAVIDVKLDGEDVGKIAFAPYKVNKRGVKRGQHVLEMTLYATRVNTFSALHADMEIDWKGPDFWYTNGDKWSYEYQLYPQGILKSPEIEVCK